MGYDSKLKPFTSSYEMFIGDIVIDHCLESMAPLVYIETNILDENAKHL